MTDSESESLRSAIPLDDIDEALGFPLIASSLISTDHLSTRIAYRPEDSAPSSPAAHLAIRHHPRVSSPRLGQIHYDDRCFESPADSPASLRYIPFSDDRPAPSPRQLNHPLRVESTALDLGADAIITCDGDAPWVTIPMLTRPLLQGDRNRVLTPASFGLEPRPIKDHAPQLWPLYATSVATGDFTTAATALTWIYDTSSLPSSQREMALSSMTVLATQGQPELALRIGDRLTRRAWNSNNIPDYLDGLIAVFSELDQNDERRELIEHRQRSAGRHFNDHRDAWYRWADIRLRLAEQRDSFGSTYRETIDSLQESHQDDWALTIWATLQMAGIDLPIVDDPDDLNPRFQAADASSLWNALRTPSLASVDSVPSTYGWVSPARFLLLDSMEAHLIATAPTSFKAGFPLSHLEALAAHDDPSPKRSAMLLGAAPLVADHELLDLAHLSLSNLTSDANPRPNELCDNLPAWQSRFTLAAHRSDQPVLSPIQRQWVGFLLWWSNEGLGSLCEGPDAFLTTLEAQADRSGPWLATLLPLLENQIIAADTTHSGDFFTRASHLAAASGDKSTCFDWSLGTALWAARQGDFERSEDLSIAASDCMDDSSEARVARDLVTAYAQFERGGGQSISRDGSIESAINRATGRRLDDHDRCVGTIPMGFRLSDHLPERINRVANAISEDTPEAASPMSLQTASTYMEEGLAFYATARRDLQRGRLVTAAHALEEAYHAFRRIDHLPALARVRFMDQSIFDGRLVELVEATDHDIEASFDTVEDFQFQDDDTYLGRIQRGYAHEVADDDPPLHYLALSYLIDGRDEELTSLIDISELPESLESLCRFRSY